MLWHKKPSNSSNPHVIPIGIKEIIKEDKIKNKS